MLSEEAIQDLVADLSVHAAKRAFEAIIAIADSAPLSLRLPTLLATMMVIEEKIGDMKEKLALADPVLIARYETSLKEFRERVRKEA